MDMLLCEEGARRLRHRFHSLCPYFATFPETFVEKHLAATAFDGVVFDPFCGRGTAVFESLLNGRRAAGCDIHPVAACVSGAKCDSPTPADVVKRLSELEGASFSFRSVDDRDGGELAEFFSLCFSPATFKQVLFLRENLNWRHDRTDRFIAAMALGALHGESHRSPNYFSNRMARTISTKPAYSVRWWRENGYVPPSRDVFSILRHLKDYRFKSEPPTLRGQIALSDARNAAWNFPHLEGRVTDVITSPPYLDTTNYREDQWLRLWFLGGDATVSYQHDDGRHYNLDKYQKFLTEAWTGVTPLLADEVRLVVRIGGRRLTKDRVVDVLESSIRLATRRRVRPLDRGVSSPILNTQANAFRGSRPSPTVEYDFCFLLS